MFYPYVRFFVSEVFSASCRVQKDSMLRRCNYASIRPFYQVDSSCASRTAIVGGIRLAGRRFVCHDKRCLRATNLLLAQCQTNGSRITRNAEALDAEKNSPASSSNGIEGEERSLKSQNQTLSAFLYRVARCALYVLAIPIFAVGLLVIVFFGRLYSVVDVYTTPAGKTRYRVKSSALPPWAQRLSSRWQRSREKTKEVAAQVRQRQEAVKEKFLERLRRYRNRQNSD